ncbi:hypothetical protein M427DRAFT_52215 [Gonapodya prolifera JEL478]|uniref:Uncharacterized protein n=1 Tax=Gonapodya prolifera (strain JEL478) TaxID=1344416 RepID=A0A139AV77_GONPJ|nr:hypothetical protein M427DRAFT_52215 [Gonapodya prolifera JEL478]|eukprot:KXS20628.1 hypothetical protein M427DRAFT_52215 [Gonapodya prolifera JEL478]
MSSRHFQQRRSSPSLSSETPRPTCPIAAPIPSTSLPANHTLPHSSSHVPGLQTHSSHSLQNPIVPTLRPTCLIAPVPHPPPPELTQPPKQHRCP